MMTDTTRELLEEIFFFFKELPRTQIKGKNLNESQVKWSDTHQVAKAIYDHLKENFETDETEETVEKFDPWTDPETKAMLELAGIPTYKYRR